MRSIPIVAAITAALTLAPHAPAHADASKYQFLDYLEKTLNDRSAPNVKEKPFAPGATYMLCFVPDGPSCEKLLVSAINRTQKTLLVQAYSFTSQPIARAVMEAHNRGIDVRVILDKSQTSERYTVATYLKNGGIPVWIDTKPAIAHNKIMIFDEDATFTGSFNFTRSAQDRNAENGIIIKGDSNIIQNFIQNWNERKRKSLVF